MTYPVTGTMSGVLEGLNYVLSGPGGLGQNFAGFSAYEPAYMTGNFRTPYSQLTPAKLYVAPISLSNAQQIDARTIKYTFTTVQATPPFSLGNGLTVTGITPAAYNSVNLRNAGYSINQIGVIECTTAYVVVRTVADITTALGTYTSGGSITFSNMNNYTSTDCDVRATIQGAQERVFISAQANQRISYTATTTSAVNIYVEISRYRAEKNYDPTNPDFVYEGPETISSKVYAFTGVTGSGLYDLETIFTSVIDDPQPGLYRYILEVYFERLSGDIEVTQNEMRLRSLTGQVVKP
tara:strand:- start:1222 stop:2106 length:885 start_codon:yes stop_codon:yes gene_type:complete